MEILSWFEVAGEWGVLLGRSIALDHALLFPEATAQGIYQICSNSPLGGPSWQRFSKPVSLGGLFSHHKQMDADVSSGEPVSQHYCELRSGANRRKGPAWHGLL